MLSKNTIKNQKEVFSAKIIKEIVDKFNFSINLLEIRAVLLCLLGFCGFMRISELLSLRIIDLSFTDSGVKIKINKSKTDQLREGNLIFISKTSTKYCPVAWLNKYILLANIGHEPNSFIFCRLVKIKDGHKAIATQPISYSTALENMRKHLPDHLDPKTYGTHSLRSGGASGAANNGVTDRMISKHGRWSLGESRDRYIKDDKEKRFSVSKLLGL